MFPTGPQHRGVGLLIATSLLSDSLTGKKENSFETSSYLGQKTLKAVVLEKKKISGLSVVPQKRLLPRMGAPHPSRGHGCLESQPLPHHCHRISEIPASPSS
jgi:hypothetical protein